MPTDDILERRISAGLDFADSAADYGARLIRMIVLALVMAAIGALVVMFLYGIVVLVFRNAFGIELPFGRFN